MTWWRFPDRAIFDAWHSAECIARRIPHPGYNAATGQPDPDAAWTTALVSPIDMPDGSVLAEIPDEWGIIPPAEPFTPTPDVTWPT